MPPVSGQSRSATPDQLPSNVHAPLSNNSRLEGLPAELRLAVLSNLDFSGFDDLVHASPVFRRSYRAFRRSILRSILANTLRNIVPDAIAESVSRASQVVEPVPFTEFHEGLRSRGPTAILDDSVSEDQVIDMVRFYRCTIQPLITAFVQWAQEKFETTEGLSHSETARITRALYRFQLYNNIRNKTESKRPRRLKAYLKEEALLAKFFCRYRPWELDELLCIHSFGEDMYDQILGEVAHDLRPNWSEQISPPSQDRTNLTNPNTRDKYAQGSTELGLEFLQDLLSHRSDHGHLVSVVEKNMRWPKHEALERLCFRMKALLKQEGQPLEDAAEEGEAQLPGDPPPFQGDDPDAAGPLLAWTMFWEGTYVHRYRYLPNILRLWGSVMWDAERILRLTQGREGKHSLFAVSDRRRPKCLSA